MTRTPKNTRKYRRMTVRILVDYQALGKIHCDYATTLGAGGMFLQTEINLKPGDFVKVRFRLPGAELLHEFESRVTWSETQPAHAHSPTHISGVGLQFKDPSAIAALARELEDYSEALAPSPR